MLRSRLVPSLLALLLAGCASVQQRPVHFKILQLNDVYKIEGLEKGAFGGLARVRTLREQLESDGSAVLILHAGDLLYPSVMSKYLEARPMIDVMNLLDDDVEAFDPATIVTFGNHEFDNRNADILLRRLSESQFRWVSSNVRRCEGTDCSRRFLRAEESIVVDIDGTRVGIFGLLYPMKKDYVHSTEVIEAARDAVASLRRQRADMIIAITHQEIGSDAELVKAVEGIDLVIGGHDHLFMQQQVGATWITKGDADAISVVVHDVTVRGREVEVTPRRVALDGSIEQDQHVQARVEEWLDQLAAKLGGMTVLGTTEHLLEGVEPAIRGRETALGNLITDAMRAHMQTDVALINGGSVRINDNIPPGPITNYDMEGIFYFSNTIVAFEVTGAQLLEMLRNAVSRFDAADGRFLQVSGLQFAHQGSEVRAEDVRVGGEPLSLDRRYSVATIDFLYLRGPEDGYTLFAEATRPPKILAEREAELRGVVERAIQAAGTVRTAVEARIVSRP